MIEAYRHWLDVVDLTAPEVQAAYIQSFATIFTAGLTALIALRSISYQITRQGKLNRDSVAETERRRVKANMWDEAVDIIRKFDNHAIDFHVTVIGQIAEIAWQIELLKNGISPNQLVVDLKGLAQLQAKCAEGAIALIYLVERRQIIDARIIIFRTAINAATKDISDIYFKDFVPFVLQRTLPIGQDGPHAFDQLSIPDAVYLRQIYDKLSEFIVTLMSYTSDFQVEMQNLLLGDLFDGSVAHRVPLDPKQRVIKLADSKALQAYFETETAWGQAMQLADSNYRRSQNPAS